MADERPKTSWRDDPHDHLTSAVMGGFEMQCPEDGAELHTVDYRSVPFQECPRCLGRWFDRGELNKAKDRTDDDLRWLDFEPFGKEADRVAVQTEGKRCPKDSAWMDALTYERSGVVIDRCPRCQGIWLNHGEFEKLVRYLEDVLLAKPAGELSRDAVHQLVEIVTGPDGIASGVRDFVAVLKMLELRLAFEHPAIAATTQKIYRLSPLK